MSEPEQIRETVRKLVEQLAAFEPAHPSFDEIAGYVDGTLDPISREIVATHVEDCARCRRELRDLRAFTKPRRRWIGWAAAAVIALAALLILVRPQPTPELPTLQTNPSPLVLRGNRQPSTVNLEPAPLTPLGAVVTSDRPTFTWSAVPGARYRVEVFDTSFRPVAASDIVTVPQWTPPRPLPRGATYVWQVTAITPAGSITAPRPPAPEARFMIR